MSLIDVVNSKVYELADTDITNICILIKQFLAVPIEQCLADFNRRRTGIINTICGGEAFNMYFHPQRLLETIDYDIKILYSNLDVYATDRVTYRKRLEQSRNEIIDKL